jgi:hypothetical protein
MDVASHKVVVAFAIAIMFAPENAEKSKQLPRSMDLACGLLWRPSNPQPINALNGRMEKATPDMGVVLFLTAAGWPHIDLFVSLRTANQIDVCRHAIPAETELV